MNILSLGLLVRNIVSAIQSKVQKTLDFSIGSVLLAMAEAQGQTGIWLQSLILQVLAWTRAQTSTGSALDLWLAQFGFTRLQGVASSGSVNLGALTAPVSPVPIPVGSLVQTLTGVKFVTTAAATLPAGSTSVSVPVTAVLQGTGGNVDAGAISQIVSAIPGIDTVTNPVAFANGVDPESDTAVRTRFVNYIATIQKGTTLAVTAAVQGVQQGLTFNLIEFQLQNGTATPAYFYVVVNNGTGNPPSSLLSTIYNAIDAVRAAGVQFNVYAPTAVTVTTSMSVTIAAGYQLSAIQAAITTAIDDYIATIPIGGTIVWSYLFALAYGVPGVTDVTNLLLNSGTADISAGTNGVIVAGTVTVN